MADAGPFLEHRPLLLGIAYRMLGSASEAEDVVQEAYLRWAAVPDGTAQAPRAYLTTRCAGSAWTSCAPRAPGARATSASGCRNRSAATRSRTAPPPWSSPTRCRWRSS